MEIIRFEVKSQSIFRCYKLTNSEFDLNRFLKLYLQVLFYQLNFPILLIRLFHSFIFNNESFRKNRIFSP